MLAALFVGLVFGFVGYHLFVAPYVLRQGLRRGMLEAAAQLKDWLESVAPEFKEKIQLSMSEYNMDQSLRRALKALGKEYRAKKESKNEEK
jgi:hypothetical protein